MPYAIRWVSVPSATPGYARFRLRASVPGRSSVAFGFGWR